MAFDLGKFVARFAEEAREHVAILNRRLVELEKRPDDDESLNAVFRSAHTIKGSSRMLKLTAITEVAHRLEDALGALRERRIRHSPALADLLFRGVDALAAMVEQAGAGGPITADQAPLCEALARAAEGAPLPGSSAASQGPPAPADPAPAAAAALPSPVEPAPAPGSREPQPLAAESIRVRTEKLDDLIRLMGELVSNQSKLKQRIAEIGGLAREARRQVELLGRAEDPAALAGARALQAGLRGLLAVTRRDKALQDVLTAEFQEKALMMRMVPISTVFDPLQRLVRDLAAALGKEVDLAVEGGDIELDKKIAEKLGDPLLHMLRNAIDHGIEDAPARERAGKPLRGRIGVSARQDAGGILIELQDDGGGIPKDRIREQALARRLSDAESLDAMPEAALLELIFLPGFSTSPMITDVSGRGVGMDVVRRNIVEELKGSVRIATREGLGSTFSIRVPTTLAVMRVLLVSARGAVFGISSRHVSEILRVPAAGIIDVVARQALRLREELIPVLELAALLGDGAPGRAPGEDRLVLVARVGGEKIGLVVDEIVDEEDLVVKNLPRLLQGARLVSGLTVSGRGAVTCILNVPGVQEAARGAAAAWPGPAAAAAGRREIDVLVVDDSVNTREIERDILESYGYRVTIAGDGIEALEMAAAKQFDLVVTDVEMPRLNGFALVERLRAEPAYREVPVVIVTSREKDEDRRRGIEVGANAYIVKGAFDQSNLVETVRHLVGRGDRP